MAPTSRNASSGAGPATKPKAKAKRKPPNRGQGKPGKPEHQPTPVTRNLVQLAMLNMLTHRQAAALLGIDPDTLRKHYPEELANGAARMLALVAGNLFRNATQTRDLKAANAAAMFLLKTRAGYVEQSTSPIWDRLEQLEAEIAGALSGGASVKVTLKIGEKTPAAS